MAVAAPVYHVLAKPTGAACNLDCTYCFYLEKEKLYPDSRFRMPPQVLEAYIRQTLGNQRETEEAMVSFQGGEPTLMGLDFFREAIGLAHHYKRPGQFVRFTIQTNGVLVDDRWARFFRANNFLVGISIDGPPELHNAYRVDKGGRPTAQKVLRGLDALKRHQVDYNILTTVHAANAPEPLRVYRYLRDELGAKYMQFIPIVERNEAGGVTERSVKPAQFGRFLNTIFDEWVKNDVGSVFVQHFDAALANWLGAPGGICVFAPTCGDAVALEHNGDLYACDHYVEPEYRLGNICEAPLDELAAQESQRRFGREKRSTLPRQCRSCRVRFACNGGCPKNRFAVTSDGEPGLNYLCAGYKAFFNHIDPAMRTMVWLLERGRPPAEIMGGKAPVENGAVVKAGPNDACPCGSGRKYKKCHGRH